MSEQNRRELPQDNPELVELFCKLCKSESIESIPDLRDKVDLALKRLSSAKDYFFGPDVKLGQEIADRIYYLIDHHEEFPEEKRHLIIGAVKYFILEKDLVPDMTPIVGLDDDIDVLNYVLDQLGLKNMFVVIGR